MSKQFIFKECATVYAENIEQAKEFLMKTLTINNDVERLRKESKKEVKDGLLTGSAYFGVFMENDINSIYERDYDKGFIYVDLTELTLEDAIHVKEIRPKVEPNGVASLPSPLARKYKCYQDRISKIEVPSIHWWTV